MKNKDNSIMYVIGFLVLILGVFILRGHGENEYFSMGEEIGIKASQVQGNTGQDFTEKLNFVLKPNTKNNMEVLQKCGIWFDTYSFEITGLTNKLNLSNENDFKECESVRRGIKNTYKSLRATKYSDGYLQEKKG